jgi:hypothetical protein
MRTTLGALLIAVTVAAAGCGGSSSSSSSAQAAAKPVLTDLRSVDQLRTLFSAHADEPRLVLLMSPT